jgi:hypothetical protein
MASASDSLHMTRSAVSLADACLVVPGIRYAAERAGLRSGVGCASIVAVRGGMRDAVTVSGSRGVH